MMRAFGFRSDGSERGRLVATLSSMHTGLTDTSVSRRLDSPVSSSNVRYALVERLGMSREGLAAVYPTLWLMVRPPMHTPLDCMFGGFLSQRTLSSSSVPPVLRAVVAEHLLSHAKTRFSRLQLIQCSLDCEVRCDEMGGRISYL